MASSELLLSNHYEPVANANTSVNINVNRVNGINGMNGANGGADEDAVSLVQLSQQSNKKCKVCGDLASYNFYGCVACDSCRTFFRRQALNKRRKQLRCTNWLAQLSRGDGSINRCIMSPKNRKSCAACRLDACFRAGMKEEHVSNASSSNLSNPLSVATTNTNSNCVTINNRLFDDQIITSDPLSEGDRKTDLIMRIAKSPEIDDPLFRDLRGNLKDRLRLTLLKSLKYGVKSTELLVHESLTRCDTSPQFPECDMNLILEVVVRRIVNAFADCSKFCSLPGVLQSAMMRKVISKAMLLRSIFHFNQNISIAKGRGEDVDLIKFDLLPLEIKALHHSCLSTEEGRLFIERYLETSRKIPACLKEDVPILVFVGIYWMFESFFKLIPSPSDSPASPTSPVSPSSPPVSSDVSPPITTINATSATAAVTSTQYVQSNGYLSSSSDSSVKDRQEFIAVLSSNDTQDIVYSEWFAIGQFLHRYVCRLYGLEAYQQVISSSSHIEQLGLMYEHLAISNSQDDFFKIEGGLHRIIVHRAETNPLYSS